MRQFVLDASITIDWAFTDMRNERSSGILRRLKRERGLAPSIWMFEVANFIAGALRGKRLSVHQAAEFATMIKLLPVEIAHEPLARLLDPVTRVATTHQLTVYDAAYLELAQREGVPLATADRALAVAARKSGVPLV